MLHYISFFIFLLQCMIMLINGLTLQLYGDPREMDEIYSGPRADPGFSFRGAQKVMCQHAHYEHGTELIFGRGPGPA